MKILFIESPPSVDWNPDSPIRTGGRRHPSQTVEEMTYSPLALSAAEVARLNGHEVKYIHAQAEGKGIDAIERGIKMYSPDLTVLEVSHVKFRSDEILSYIAQKHGSKVVWTGSLATALHMELIRNPFVDFIARREYDAIIAAIPKFGNRTWGITWKTKGNNVKVNKDMPFIKDLDKLPFPAYDLVDLSKFKESVFLRLPCATMFASRGCRFNCTFCNFPETLWDHRPRGMSPGRILSEVMYLQQEFDIREIRFDDDDFGYDRKRTIDICKEFQKEGLDLIWNNQMRPSVSKEEAEELAKAGCHKILFGVESGSQRILNYIRKGTTIEQIRQGQENTRKNGISRHNCYMIGFLDETKEEVERTLRFADELNSEFAQFSIATALPGTCYYDMIRKVAPDFDWRDVDSFHKPVSTPNFEAEWLEEKVRNAYRDYYMSRKRLWMFFKRHFRGSDYRAQNWRLYKTFKQRRKMGWN